jgi:hypothetical protein
MKLMSVTTKLSNLMTTKLDESMSQTQQATNQTLVGLPNLINPNTTLAIHNDGFIGSSLSSRAKSTLQDLQASKPRYLTMYSSRLDISQAHSCTHLSAPPAMPTNEFPRRCWPRAGLAFGSGRPRGGGGISAAAFSELLPEYAPW